jgi:hypothetical protein
MTIDIGIRIDINLDPLFILRRLVQGYPTHLTSLHGRTSLVQSLSLLATHE